MSLKHPYSAMDIAQVYLDSVFRFHGCPKTIVSDSDSIFISQFWQAIFPIQGTSLSLSSAYHPKTNDQTEIVNKCLESFLRGMCGRLLKTSLYGFHLLSGGTIRISTLQSIQPLMIQYIISHSPLYRPYLLGETKAMIKMLQFHLKRAQHRQKVQADKHRSERSFIVGTWVWLKSQSYKQKSLKVHNNEKLSSIYFGPFQIIGVVDQVALKAQTP